MTDQQNQDYPIVGRDAGINLDIYTTTILGRKIIDYDKLKQADPVLYQRVLNQEAEANAEHDVYVEKLLKS